MALSPSKDGISSEDWRILRLFKVVQSEGSYALRHVFKWGCKKNPNESLSAYLRNKGWTPKALKERFDTTMKNNMNKDPTGDTYDVSLLWACIKFGCEGLAGDGKPEWVEGQDDKIESIATSIKNFRNRLCHGIGIPDDKCMTEMCDDLKNNLMNLISLAGMKYSHEAEVVKVQQDIEENIKKIMAASLSINNIAHYEKELEELREEQKKIVKETGKTHLIERYKDMSRVDPASFITGKERLEVRKVFTQLEVVRERTGCGKKGSDDPDLNVECDRILELRTDKGERPAVLLVEGDPGAGKTTIAKLILNDWANHISDESSDPHNFDDSIHGLDDFDLVLYAEGRNKSISSFLALLRVLMPFAASKLADDDLVRSVLGQKVLLIIDGLDEVNAASQALISELLDKCLKESCNRLHLLITTRPQMLPELPNIIKNHSMIHTRLKGISPDKWEEFVSKLHDEMRSEGQSDQDTSLLVDFVRQSRVQLGEHFRLPLNLTLLTYLWAADPMSVNSVTTATSLYIELHKLVQSRLVKRLKDHGNPPGLYSDEIHNYCQPFFQKLYAVCLETLKTGFIQLSDDSVFKLKKVCSNLHLKSEEMTAPFLCVEKEWNAYGYRLDLFVPHKSIMEFYAAQSFLDIMVCPLQVAEASFSEEDEKKFPSYIEPNVGSRQTLHKLVQKLLNKNIYSDSLSSFFNMFLHLGGLLAHEDDTAHLKEYAKELVLILDKADVKPYQWLDLVVETKCNEDVALLVAGHIKKLGVRDGHTGAAIALFPHLPSNIGVEIILETEVRFVPQLKELLHKVAGRDCYLQVLLKHQWKNSDCGSSDTLLAPLYDKEAKCTLGRVTGYLEDLKCLPKTVTNLRLSIVSDAHAEKMLQQLRTMIESKHLSLEYLGLHVLPGVKGEALTKLPRSATLWLSGVDDDSLDRAVKVISVLISEQECSGLYFPQSNLTPDGVKDLVLKLSEANVRIKSSCRGLFVTCPTLTPPKRKDLLKLTKNKLKCDLVSDERNMW